MDIEEVINRHVKNEDLATGFQAQRAEFQARLSRIVAGYRLEQVNLHNSEEGRQAALATIERDIRFLAWAIEEIDRRLALNNNNERKQERA